MEACPGAAPGKRPEAVCPEWKAVWSILGRHQNQPEWHLGVETSGPQPWVQGPSGVSDSGMETGWLWSQAKVSPVTYRNLSQYRNVSLWFLRQSPGQQRPGRQHRELGRQSCRFRGSNEIRRTQRKQQRRKRSDRRSSVGMCVGYQTLTYTLKEADEP